MQRLNTAVFERPDLVMRNLQVLGAHMDRRMATPPPELQGRRWELPRIVPCRNEDSAWVEHNGEFWRSITYISAATTSNEIQDCNQANELGYALGMFHNLIHDLAIHQLADTLENFHVTPEYLNRFDTVLKSRSVLDEGEILGSHVFGTELDKTWLLLATESGFITNQANNRNMMT